MDEDAVAKRRWTVMQACRLAGLACVLMGVYTLAERGLDRPEVGYPLLLIGAAGFFALPIFLSRRWKSR